jgi:hypothetical protein
VSGSDGDGFAGDRLDTLPCLLLEPNASVFHHFKAVVDFLVDDHDHFEAVLGFTVFPLLARDYLIKEVFAEGELVLCAIC